MPGPLPLAPRPYPEESLSCWVARVAARYDVTADDLCRYLLGRQSLDIGRVERLDHRADPELVDLLAAAARIAPARLRAMRIAVDDGTAASCWHRTTAAWCPECIRGDLAGGPEVYERARWRLGCSVVCPDHGVLFQDACRQCWKKARCQFQPADGRLRLACSFCSDLPYPLDQHTNGLRVGHTATFRVQLTARLVALVSALQRDLQTAISGAAPHKSWGFIRSGGSLLMVVRHMAFSIVLSTNTRFEQRTEVLMATDHILASPVLYEPVTPAALPSRFAFGALAIVAAVLDSLEAPGEAGHIWEQDGVPPAMDAASFLSWLNDDGRNWLRGRSRHWDRQVNAAFWAACAGMQARQNESIG